MDQKKIGSFLKELRKEKDITQEQLAEKIKVSGRTVSRWETGSNMPDISLLAQLADFYDVSIPEIIDGERKSENMNEEVKETVLKLSDYTETINQKIKGRLFVLTVIAIIGMIAFVIIEFTGLDTPGSVYERVAGAGLGLDCGMLIVLAMYLSGLLGKIKARREMKRKYGTNITNGPRVQMQTAGSKKKEDWTEVSKEQLAEVKLPASFDKLKEQNSYFYHGENISDYELVQTAVALGKMELPTDEKKCIPDRVAMDAFEVLVRDQAAPKNSWSNTLYSEDGKYTFTKTESGRWQMHLIDDAAIGASLEDIANWMMSGTPNRNIETRYLNHLHTVDPDLYNVAMRIGTEVRSYGFMEDLHQQGVLSDSQNQYDMSLLGMLFGKDADSMRMILHGCKESGNFLELLDLYSPDGAKSLDKLREQQYKHGGIV